MTCGSAEDDVSSVVRGALESERCPLCESALGGTVSEPATGLTELDNSIVAQQRSIAAGERVSDGMSAQLADARSHLDATAEEIARYERENDLALLRGRGELDAVGERYRAAMAEQNDGICPGGYKTDRGVTEPSWV